MKSSLIRLSWGTVGCATAAVALMAVQGAAQVPGQTPSPEATFKVEVNYVEEDVRVIDKAGNFIRGLKQEDFQLVEDKKPQRISTFAAVDIPFVARPRPLYAGPSALPLDSDVASNIEDAEGRVYVLVADDYHISTQRTADTRRLLRQFILEHLGTNDYAALIVTSGLTQSTQDFTQNRQLLLNAVDRFVGQKLPPATLAIMEARSDPNTAGAGVEDPDEFEREANARSTLRTLSNVAEWMGSIRGRRKAVIYFSEGVDYAETFDIFSSPAVPTGNPLSATDRQHHIEAVRDATQDAIMAASRSNVQIYAIDPRGLTTGDDGILIGGTLAGTSVPGPQSLRDELRASQENLRQISDATGGVAAVNTNDFRPAFERIVQENSAYYVLGYYPTNEKLDGKTRTVNIKVAGHPDAKLSYRSRYLAPRKDDKDKKKAPEKPGSAAPAVSTQLMETMANPLPQTGLTLRISAVPHKGVGKNAALDLLIEATGSELAFTEGGGLQNDTLVFMVQVLNREGKATVAERFNVNLKLKPESYALVRESGVRIIRTLAVPPGVYGVRIAGEDSVGNKRGSARFDVEVPDFSANPTALSGIVLASASANAFSSWDRSFGETLPAPPTAVREFPSGDQLAAYVEVYDNQPAPVHKIEITTTVRADSGKVVFTHADERSTEELHGTPGGFSYMATIPLTDWPSGPYVMTIEAKSTAGNAKPVSRVIPFKVR